MKRPSSLSYLKRKYGINHKPCNNLTNWSYHVRYRDNFTCQDCGVKPEDKQLVQAHHIKPKRKFPQLKFDVNNGVALCDPCHKKRDAELE